jgi:hypothetical protein
MLMKRKKAAVLAPVGTLQNAYPNMGAGCSRDTAAEIQTHVATVMRTLLARRGAGSAAHSESKLNHLVAESPMTLDTTVALSGLWNKYGALDVYGECAGFEDECAADEFDGTFETAIKMFSSNTAAFAEPFGSKSWASRTVAPMMPFNDSHVVSASLRLWTPDADTMPRLAIAWSTTETCKGTIRIGFHWAHLAYLCARWAQAVPADYAVACVRGKAAGFAASSAAAAARGDRSPMFLFKDLASPTPPFDMPQCKYPDHASDAGATAFDIVTPCTGLDDDDAFGAYKVVTLPSKAVVELTADYTPSATRGCKRSGAGAGAGAAGAAGAADSDDSYRASSQTETPVVVMVPQFPMPESPGGGNVVFMAPTRLMSAEGGAVHCLQHMWCHVPVAAVLKWLRGAVQVIMNEAKESAESAKAALPALPLIPLSGPKTAAVLTLLDVHRCLACNCCNADALVCSRCKDAWYCDAECQRRHWKLHRSHCKAVASASCKK